VYEETTFTLSPDDPQLKKTGVLATSGTQSQEMPSIRKRPEYFSDWNCARKAVATCLRLKTRIQTTSSEKSSAAKNTKAERGQSKFPAITVDELRQAEIAILRLLQGEAFEMENRVLRSCTTDENVMDRAFAKQRNCTIKTTSSLYRLDPFLDSHGILRLGGRIKQANLPYDLKHPVMLPKKSDITELIVRHHLHQVKHQGRGITLNSLRSNGYWVIGGTSVVRNLISRCVVCGKLRGPVSEKKTADLPEDRLQSSPPFTYCAVDYFVPWLIKEGRQELKRYGVLFTCLASRAIHLESANALTTDTFINALRRFLSRRGPTRLIRSDRGTNFVGAKSELENAAAEMDEAQIHSFLLGRDCNWFEFKTNPPSASHIGGVWERQIRSARNVLCALQHGSGQQLDDESLQTFMCEAEAIVNSRPLTTDGLATPFSPEPLIPSHLLTMKSNVLLPPSGDFKLADLYCRKRWRRVQHLTN